MSETLTSSPFVHGPNSVNRVMLQVVYALVPAVAAYIWFFGWGVLVNILWASAVALGLEAAVLAARRKPMRPYLTDGSALVTAVLLAFALPPLAPWWLTVVGVVFAIVIAKHLYGGLGFNPFNPAMVGYVTLLISFPLEMTTWPAAQAPHLGPLQALGYIFTGDLPAGLALDTISGATPLDAMKTQLGLERTVSEVLRQPTFGAVGGAGWEIVNGLVLLGGLWLVFRRTISWHTPVGMLGALFVIALVFHLSAPDQYAGPFFHLASGGAILGAFFIATDPVSGATSARGRLLFGAGAGILTYVIRTWGGYPDGVAFSVLLMNMAAPTIDYYTQPRVFGHSRE